MNKDHTFLAVFALKINKYTKKEEFNSLRIFLHRFFITAGLSRFYAWKHIQKALIQLSSFANFQPGCLSCF
jgi:hypothetical protein